MRVLVTGSTGFIAANLLRRLLKQGHEVHCIVRPTSDLWRLEELEARLITHVADIGKAKEIDAVFMRARPEWLFHLATVRADTDDFNSYFSGNVVIAANLIGACRKYPPARVVVHGSSLEYGHSLQPLSETMVATPTTPHGSTKLCATLLFLQAYQSFQLPVSILRLFSVYGPWESANRLTPKALLAGLDGGTLRLTPPGICRDYIFVEDVVEASLLAATNDAAVGAIINIGSGIQTSNEALVTRINDLTGNRIHIGSHDYPRHATDTGNWVADMEKCRALLGWVPPTTLTDGLRQYMEWLKRHRQLAHYA